MNKPTEQEVEKMRHELAMNDVDTLEEGSLYDIMREGCTGYNHFSNEDIIKLHAEILGDEDDTSEH
jgi:hypothetical protein